MKSNKITVAVVVVLVGIGGFFGGMKFQESKSRATINGARNAGGANRFGGGQNGQIRNDTNRPVAGEILSIDDSSFTVKLQDGSSKIVLLSEKTTYNKSSDGAKTDLKSGIRVVASGTTNPDGSVTANTVAINPSFGGMGGRMQNSASTSSDVK